MQEDARLTLADLARLTDTPVRTIRSYIQAGLLDRPKELGPHATYPRRNLDRLRFVRRMRELGLSLAVIADLFAQLDEEQIRRVGAGEEGVCVLPLGGGVVGGSAAVPAERGPRAEEESMTFEEREPRTRRRRGEGDAASVRLKRVGIAQIEEALAEALGSLTGAPYEVTIRQIVYGDRPFPKAPRGGAMIQLEVAPGEGAEEVR